VASGRGKSSTSTGNRGKQTAETAGMDSLETADPTAAVAPLGDSPDPAQPVPEPALAQTDAGDAQIPADAEPAGDAPPQPPQDSIAEAIVLTEPEAPPPPAPASAPRSGMGIVPLVIGGVVAAGIGYGAAYLGLLPTAQRAAPTDPAVSAALGQQGEALAALQEQIAAIGAAVAAGPATMQDQGTLDLSPVLGQIAALSTQIAATSAGIDTLATRVGALENRPVFTGNADADLLAAQEAADARAAELAAERDAIAAEAAALQEAALAAATQAAEAEAAAARAIAEAEAAAQAAVTRAAVEAGLGQLQAALADGAPYAAPLATLAASLDIPAALQASAETGVPTQAQLTRDFAPLARAALPVALQETAGDSIGDRLGAFVMGQIGGRAVAPRAGDDPDAVLSRVGAAIAAGDLDRALAEIAALPQGAQAVLAPLAQQIAARRDAVAGLATVTAALAASAN
jgi:hypothetical protein